MTVETSRENMEEQYHKLNFAYMKGPLLRLGNGTAWEGSTQESNVCLEKLSVEV